MTSFRKYIGDGVYANFDGHSLILTTEDGYNITNQIVLHTDVLANLNKYVKNLTAHGSINIIKKQV